VHVESVHQPGLPELTMTPKRPADSATEMVQVVLPNDANPLGFILGGTVMHLIDIAGAIACHRHTRSLLVTAAVDGLQFLHSIKVGDLIILKAMVTAAWSTSLEVEVEVFSEETLTGVRRMTSLAYLTFVAIDRDGHRLPVPGLILETEEERRRAAEAEARRAQRLAARKALESRLQAQFPAPAQP
jgi:acyl-CoA hydrolase